MPIEANIKTNFDLKTWTSVDAIFAIFTAFDPGKHAGL